MPKAGYCTVCGKNVWLAKNGSCVNGHPSNVITGVYEAPLQPNEAEQKSKNRTTEQESKSKKSELRIVLTIVIILFVFFCSTVGGGYFYYSSSKKAMYEAELEAFQRFHETYINKYMAHAGRFAKAEESDKLAEEYDKLRKQRNGAGAIENNAEVLRLVYEINTNLIDTQMIYNERSENLSEKRSNLILLSSDARQLSGQNKEVALGIVKKARRLVANEEKYVDLKKDCLILKKNLNESYELLVMGHITVPMFNDDMDKYNRKTDEINEKINEIDRQIQLEEEELRDEWAKLRELIYQ